MSHTRKLRTFALALVALALLVAFGAAPARAGMSTSGGGVTWAGDLAGSTNSSQKVVALTGSAGTVTASAGTIKETGTTLSIADSGATVRDVIETTHGRITAGGGGTDYSVVIGPRSGAETSSGSLHILPNGTALTATNYQFAYDGSQSYFNNPTGGSLSFQISASPYLTVATATIDVVPPAIEWGSAVLSPTLKQVTGGATSNGQNLTIAPQAGGATSGVPGSFVVNLAAPNGGSNEALWKLDRAGVDRVVMGRYSSATDYTVISLGNPATATSYAVMQDTSNNIHENSPGGTLYFELQGSTSFYQHLIAAGHYAYQGYPGVVSTLDVGTATNAAVMNVQGGNAVTGVSVSAPGSTAGTATTTVIGAMQYTTRTVTASFTVDTTTTDHVVYVDCTSAAVTVTLPPVASSNGRDLYLIDKKNNCDPAGGKALTIAPGASVLLDNALGNRAVATVGFRIHIWGDGAGWYSAMTTKAQ